MATMYQYRNRSPSFVHFAQKNENYDEAQIAFQPYRTTPLVLPGAKVSKKDALPTESYLRHHPNPAMRAPPLHDFTDTLMRQKVAETVIHRVIGDEPPSGPKLVHKQFNSPIGLYSDGNIENTVRQTQQQQQQQPPQSQAVPIFIDLSFLQQKQKILEEQRRQDQENKLKHQYPFPSSYASSSSLHSSSGHSSPMSQHSAGTHPMRQPTLSPPPIPPLPGHYQQHRY